MIDKNRDIVHQTRRWLKALKGQFAIADDPQMPDEARQMAWKTACRYVVLLMKSMPIEMMNEAIEDMRPFPLHQEAKAGQ